MARPNTDQANLASIALVMEVPNALKGKTFSITGHLGLPRADVVKIIHQSGGKFEERPRHGVNYLITNNDWTKGTIKGKVSSKFDEARRLGIKILSEDEFYKLIIEADDTSKAS